jgi:hypothetical protein
MVCVLLLSALPACTQSDDATEVLEQVYLLNELSFEFEELIGQKVWCLGVYGDTRFSDLGIAFLVADYDMLMVDERMNEHSYAVLDGDLPPTSANGAEMLVYGTVSEFGEAYDAFVSHPTPLISVEKHHILQENAVTEDWENRFIETFTGGVAALIAPQARVTADDAPEGTKPTDCDRALILSGGIDAANDKPRYKDNIKLKYAKLKELGFPVDHIDVLYNDGAEIPTDGDPIKPQKATLANVKAAIEKYGKEMPPSCTLTIFVTDHGTGYSPEQGYDGARPAFEEEDEYKQGVTYPENTFKVDAQIKVYKLNTWTNRAGDTWRVTINKDSNLLELYKREGGKWVYKGKDVNGDGNIVETETGQDIDGDGHKTNLGWGIGDIGDWKHRDNEYDTDYDGKKDVRMHWDAAANKYVFQRFVDPDWKTMGEDTNGDFIIDGTDGGVDWDLDKGDRIGFHEGINLWDTATGKDSVLWDDEFASMLKELDDKGIHVVIEMVQCFGGGFITNLDGIVEKIVTGSGEETKHANRTAADKTLYAADEKAFVENLHGIDAESWDYAFDKAKEADEAAWTAAGSDPKDKNEHEKWERPVIATDSGVSWVDGDYELVLRLPEDQEGRVYDFEILFGLQKPRWSSGTLEDAPLNYGWERIPGGFRVKSTDPFPLTPQLFKLRGTGGNQALKVQLTDREHEPLGYTFPSPMEPIPHTPEEALGAELDPDVDVGWVEGYCEGTLTVDFAGIDLSGGDSPLARVVLRANGTVWADSGLLPKGASQYEDSIAKAVLCGQRFRLEVEVTNIFGQVVTREQEVVIPTPSKQQEWTPPPIIPPVTPPPTDLPTQTILQASVAVSGKSVQSGEACTSTIIISYDGTDLTGGDYPVTRVVLTVNGSVWHDSGSISQTQYHHVESRSAACGQTFNISVAVTNSIGRTATASGSYTTPVP